MNESYHSTEELGKGKAKSYLQIHSFLNFLYMNIFDSALTGWSVVIWQSYRCLHGCSLHPRRRNDRLQQEKRRHLKSSLPENWEVYNALSFFVKSQNILAFRINTFFFGHLSLHGYKCQDMSIYNSSNFVTPTKYLLYNRYSATRITWTLLNKQDPPAQTDITQPKPYK